MASYDDARLEMAKHNLERRIEVVGLRARIAYDTRFDVELYRFATSLVNRRRHDPVERART